MNYSKTFHKRIWNLNDIVILSVIWMAYLFQVGGQEGALPLICFLINAKCIILPGLKKSILSRTNSVQIIFCSNHLRNVKKIGKIFWSDFYSSNFFIDNSLRMLWCILTYIISQTLIGIFFSYLFQSVHLSYVNSTF